MDTLIKHFPQSLGTSILDVLTTIVFAASLVEMSQDFRKQVKDAIEADEWWKDMLAVTRRLASRTTSKSSKLGYFEVKNDMLHRAGSDLKTRLVISRTLLSSGKNIKIVEPLQSSLQDAAEALSSCYHEIFSVTLLCGSTRRVLHHSVASRRHDFSYMNS